MNELLTLTSDKLSGWDFLIAGIIVLAVEYIVKLAFKKANENVQTIAAKVAPVILGAVIYLVISLVEKSTVTTALLHGIFVGLTAMGSYDIILKTIKENGLSEANTKIEEALKDGKE